MVLRPGSCRRHVLDSARAARFSVGNRAIRRLGRIDGAEVHRRVIDEAKTRGDRGGYIPCVTDDGQVAPWVVCRKCRYNLFGLDAHGNCPECGTAILHSTVASLVRSLPAAWLIRVRHGVGLLRLAIAAAFLIVPVAVAATAWSKTLIWTAPMLLGLGLLSVATAGQLLVRADEASCPQRLRELREEFTGSLVIGPVLAFLLVLIAGLLIPPVSAPARSLEISLLSILKVTTAGLLLSLAVYVALRPITAFIRFLAELFEHAWPMSPERECAVHNIIVAAQCLLVAAIGLGLASGQIRDHSISRGASGLAGFAALCGGTTFAAAIGMVYWILGDVRIALSCPIFEALRREQEEPSNPG